MVEANRARFISGDLTRQMQWEFMAPLIDTEVIRLTGARLLKRENAEYEDSIPRKFVVNLLAAELFVNEDLPRFVIAENEAQTHEDIRDKDSMTDVRISGQMIEIKNQDCRFFSMDSIGGEHSIIPGNKSLKEIVDFLLSENIVPMDASRNIIYPHTLD